MRALVVVRLCTVFVSCVILPASAAANQIAGLTGRHSAYCSNNEADNAEHSVDHLENWKNVYDSYQKYGACDDGAVAEGYSYSVARLLQTRWRSTLDLYRLAERDPKFEAFVLEHINGLMSPEQAREIRANARKNCPAKANELCKKLVHEIERPE